MDSLNDRAELFKLLSHPARLAILDMLRDGEECVCHMTAMLGARQAYVSQQLMILRDAGLVIDRRDGWNIYYHVTRPEIYRILDSALAMTGEQREASRTSVLRRRSASCPCPRCQAVRATAAK